MGLKVAISGLGGDELFGGYPSFNQIPRLVNALGWLPGLPSIGRLFRVVTSPVIKRLTSENMLVFSNLTDHYQVPIFCAGVFICLGNYRTFWILILRLKVGKNLSYLFVCMRQQKVFPMLERKFRPSNFYGTCVINFFGILIGQAWPIHWKSGHH